MTQGEGLGGGFLPFPVEIKGDAFSLLPPHDLNVTFDVGLEFQNNLAAGTFTEGKGGWQLIDS